MHRNTNYSEAVALFQKTEKEKRAKGYTDLDKHAELKARIRREVYSIRYTDDTTFTKLCDFIEAYVEERV